MLKFWMRLALVVCVASGLIYIGGIAYSKLNHYSSNAVPELHKDKQHDLAGASVDGARTVDRNNYFGSVLSALNEFSKSSVEAQSAEAQSSKDAQGSTSGESQAQDDEANSGIPQESLPDYPAQGIHAGVWNDGQSALWDLNALDYFHYFGPEQRAKGHKPEQPINFSHIVHVQQNKMECQYCHWSVAKAGYAALPDVESCMGCHKLVKGKAPDSQKEIAKLDEYYNQAKPIPWVKVHVMPNHYKFNHKRHVKAGVSCHQCHGQIPEMPVVERVSSMKMGWCLDCHRQKGASIDCMTCHY